MVQMNKDFMRHFRIGAWAVAGVILVVLVAVMIARSAALRPAHHLHERAGEGVEVGRAVDAVDDAGAGVLPEVQRWPG